MHSPSLHVYYRGRGERGITVLFLKLIGAPVEVPEADGAVRKLAVLCLFSETASKYFSKEGKERHIMCSHACQGLITPVRLPGT